MPTRPASPSSRQQLRAQMRQVRRSMPATVRARAAHEVAARIAHHFHLPRGARIGAYLTVGSELDTAPLLGLAARRGWQVYVPQILHGSTARMRFVRLRGPLRLNRYGIPEPQGAAESDWIAPRWLDVAFLPLLAAGPGGERLGAGAGYYDRAFAYRLQRRAWHKPPLVGLAYECQRLPAFERAAWDVPLDALITELALHRYEAS